MSIGISGNKLNIAFHFGGSEISIQDGTGGVFATLSLSAKTAQQLLKELDTVREEIQAMKPEDKK